MEKIMKNKRLLALDFGSKTVGVAITDELHVTISLFPVIRREKPTKFRKTFAEIEKILSTYEIEKIVLGFPYNMNGSKGKRCKETEIFKESLSQRIDIPIILYDERLTTVEAYDIMKEYKIDKSKQMEIVDSVAAAVILRSYLNQNEN